jgi:hypothetical protein
MKHDQSSLLQTLRDVQQFLDDNAGIVGPAIASSRKNLDDVVTALAAHADDQQGGSVNGRGETAKQKALRLALRNTSMKPIAEVAKLKLRDVPEFHALRMPPANATSSQLVAMANAMAEAAKVHEAVFTSVGLPDDFIAQMLTAAQAITASASARGQHVNRRIGGTAGLAAEETRGRATLRLIDAIVRPRIGTNDSLLAKWVSVKKVPKKPGPVATVVVSAAPVATAAAVASAPVVVEGQKAA